MIQHCNEKYECDQQEAIADELHGRPRRSVNALGEVVEPPRTEQPRKPRAAVPGSAAPAIPVAPAM